MLVYCESPRSTSGAVHGMVPKFVLREQGSTHSYISEQEPSICVTNEINAENRASENRMPPSSGGSAWPPPASRATNGDVHVCVDGKWFTSSCRARPAG